MSNNNQNNATVNNKKKLRISVTEKIPFEPELSVKTYKSQIIADEIINPMFNATFKDYKGCMINVNGIGKCTVDLYFVKGKVSDAEYEALENIGVKKGTDTLSRIQRVNQLSSRNKIYQLTDNAKELLYDFMINKNKKGEVNWNQSYVEIEGVTETGIRQATGKVIGLDLNLILREAYGFRNEQGNTTYFNVTPLRRLIPFNQMPGAPLTNDWLLRVECLDANATEDTLKMLGNGAIANGIPMYTV